MDKAIDSIDPQKKIDLAFAAEKEVLGKDDRVISVTASYYDGMDGSVLVTSNGFEGDSYNSYFGVHASVSVKGGDARPSAGWNKVSLFFDQLETADVGTTALQLALEKLGQAKNCIRQHADDC